LDLKVKDVPEDDYEAGKMLSAAHGIAIAVPSIDFLVWNQFPYAVVRSNGDAHHTASVVVKELPSRGLEYGRSVDIGGDDADWLEMKDVPLLFSESV
jgi:hypothetical protein